MGKMMFCRMCVFAAMYEWEYECSFVSASMQQCKSLFLCICINICLNFSCVRSYFSDSKSKKWHPLLFLKIVTCINMEWGFKMRYYKGHMFLCQSYFNFFFLCFFFFLIIKHYFFSNHTFHMGSLVYRCPKHHCVSSLFPSRRERCWCFF